MDMGIRIEFFVFWILEPRGGWGLEKTYPTEEMVLEVKLDIGDLSLNYF